MTHDELIECPKCRAFSGDDWSQCNGSCPMKGSPHYKEPTSDNDLVERVARDIADALGDNFNYAFAGKTEWITHRGETVAGFRDVNQPYKSDYMDAARAAISVIAPAVLEEAAKVAPAKIRAEGCETVGQWERRALREAIRALKTRYE